MAYKFKTENLIETPRISTAEPSASFELNFKLWTTKPAADLLRLAHKSIKAVSQDLSPQRYIFNTAIARCMELLNALYKFTGEKDAFNVKTNNCLAFSVKNLLLLLAPMAPHITEEIWHLLGFAQNKNELNSHSSIGQFIDEKLTIDSEIELVLQVNGQIVNKQMVKRGLTKEEVESLALSDNKILAKIDGAGTKNNSSAR